MEIKKSDSDVISGRERPHSGRFCSRSLRVGQKSLMTSEQDERVEVIAELLDATLGVLSVDGIIYINFG